MKLFIRYLFKQQWMELAVPFTVMCLLFIGFSIEVPNYLSIINLQQLMRDFAEPAMIAIAVVIFAGGIDLSVGATFALANFTALYLFRIHELPLIITLLGVIAIGSIIGMINGFLVAYVKTRPFLTTLATLLILRSVYDMVVLSYTIELATAMHDTDSWYLLGAGNILGIPTNMVVLLALSMGLYFFLTRLRPGIHIMAVGSNRKASRHAGINIKKTLFLSYVISGIMAAIAGLFYAAKQNSAGSDTGLGWELTALTAVVLGGISLTGGRGSIARVLIGSMILFLLSSGLLRMNVPGSLTSALIGFVLIMAVAANIKWDKLKGATEIGSLSFQEHSAMIVGSIDEESVKIFETKSAQPILKIKSLSKLYNGNHALHQVDFELFTGEVHSLVGENGAGKSTLSKIISGAVKPSSGELIFDGEVRYFNSPSDSLHAGIAMVYQESSLIPTMTVAQNMQFGIERFVTNPQRVNSIAKEALQSININISPSVIVEKLSAAQQRLVEIARAVHLDAKVLIFDEPTACLTPWERQTFFQLVSSLRAKNIAIIFISHALEEVLTISDRITILCDGENVRTGLSVEFTKQSLVSQMVGRDIAIQHSVNSNKPKSKSEVLQIKNISMANILNNVSFSLYGGEILGIVGLVGSGRTEIAKIIAGINQRSNGDVFLHGEAVSYRSPEEAIKDGIVYITESRNVDGYFNNMNVHDNIYIPSLMSKRSCWYSSSKRDRVANQWIKMLSIASLDNKQNLNSYSGGNQQKVVIAKALALEPTIIIFDEPTNGVDVGVIPQIHEIIRSLANEGKSVIVISSYLPEILEVSDRILVMQQGTISAELDAKEATEAQIMSVAIHSSTL